MTKKIIDIHPITQRILSSSVEKDVEHILDLYNFYTHFPIEKDHQGEIILQNGIALSKENAADCMLDYKRTCCFIRGIYKAIIECQKKFPTTRLNILYAGCGPFAPLLLPLLSFFEPEQINATLIDINKSSIKSIKNIISTLGYDAYISNSMVANAIHYQYPKTKALHMIITETMFHALTKEPQVAITQNLAPQLTEGGVLIPEEIHVSFGYSFFAKEPFLNQHNEIYYINNITHQNIKRESMEPLFSVTKNTQRNDIDPYYFESRWYPVPENYEETPDICIYTHIKVFDIYQLQYEDSLITNPYCLFSLYNIAHQSNFKIKYSIHKIPDWEISVSCNNTFLKSKL